MLSDEQIRKIDEKYSQYKDDEIIERLAYLDVIDGEKSITISDKSLDEELLSISRKIWNIQEDFNRIKVMYELFISDVADFISMEKKLRRKQISIEENSVNRYFVHLLSSGKLFIDFNENQIKKKYSKNSDVYKKTHSFASYQFDSNFSYRFCYYLRNFSQHIGLPITHISATELHNNQDELDISLCIDLDYLLNSSFEWKKLYSELDDYRKEQSFVDVSMIVDEYLKSIVTIYGDYNKLFLELNHEELIALKSALIKLGLKPARYYISKISKYDLKFNPTNYSLSPLAGFPEIDEIYVELSKIGLVNLINK